MGLLSSIGGLLSGKTFTNKIFGGNSTMGRMLNFSSPFNIKKNWSEYVFGGGLPIQAGMRAMKLKNEDKATEEMAQARVAAHNAEVQQLANDSLGAVSMRRRRGMYATILTGSNPLGTGKSVLGS